MKSNPSRWGVFSSKMPVNEKHPYNQIAHRYDDGNLNMKAYDTQANSFGFIKSVSEDSVITIKMDGEFDICVFDINGTPDVDTKGKSGKAPIGLTTVFSTLNTIKWGFPVLDEIADILKNQGINRAIFAGELLVYASPPLRAGPARAFKGREDQVHYYIFDIIELDGQPVQGDYVSRMTLAQSLMGAGERVHTVYWEKGGPDVARDIWENRVVPNGEEGLVVRTSGGVIKVKIVHPIDLLVVGYKEGAGKNSGQMGAVMTATRDKDGIYRFNASVGTGFTNADRDSWWTFLKGITVSTTKIDGDEYFLVNPDKSKVIEVECNEFSKAMTHSYAWDGANWDFTSKKLTHLMQKPRMKNIRKDKINTIKDLRMEQFPDWVEESIFEVNINSQIITDHNKSVFVAKFDAIKEKEAKKEIARWKKEHKIDDPTHLASDQGELMEPDFIRSAFLDESIYKKHSGGGAWGGGSFGPPGVTIKPEVSIPTITLPDDMSPDPVPKVGEPQKFPQLRYTKESQKAPKTTLPSSPEVVKVEQCDAIVMKSPKTVDSLEIMKSPKIVKTGDVTKKGKEIVVTYYPEPVPGIPLSEKGVVCSCGKFLIRGTCKHVEDSEIIKLVKSNPGQSVPYYGIKTNGKDYTNKIIKRRGSEYVIVVNETDIEGEGMVPHLELLFVEGYDDGGIKTKFRTYSLDELIDTDLAKKHKQDFVPLQYCLNILGW